MKTKYKEIHKLKKMLEDANIPFDWIEGWGYDEIETERLRKITPDLMERYQICYPEGSFNHTENRQISVIQGFGTYGSERDRLEIMGGLTPMEVFEQYISLSEESHMTVQGGLTARNVFKRIEYDWRKRNGKENC